MTNQPTLSESRFPTAKCRRAWEILTDTPVTNGNVARIDAGFAHFKRGAALDDVWHWFEREFNVSIAVLQGVT